MYACQCLTLKSDVSVGKLVWASGTGNFSDGLKYQGGT